jgi:hypothetical protein
VAPTPLTLEETPPTPAPPPRAATPKPHERQQSAPPPGAPPPREREEKRLKEDRAPAGEAPPEALRNKDDKDDDDDDDDDDGGIFGPFRIGVLVGGGLPSVLSFGGILKLTRYLGAGVNVGLIPTIKVSLYGDAELSYQEYDLYGRLFPFGGALFVGAGVGYANIKGRFSTQYDVSAFQSAAPGLPNPLSVTSEGSVRTLVLTPTLGLLHTFGSGFTLGIDVGAQIPIAPSETKFDTQVPRSVPQAVIDKYVKPNDKKVQDTLDTVGRAILPTLNLRLGWLL